MDLQIAKIDEFIQSHLKQDFSLMDISSYVGYSPYHLSRAYKASTGRTLMDYVKEKKIMAAAQEIAQGETVLQVALAFGFDTHSGFTRAFTEVIGCTPQEYRQHSLKMEQKGDMIMDLSTLKIRLVCEDDVNSLWENVYSAMTPRQILDYKVLPSIENYKAGKGFLAVAEVEREVVMSMWVERLYSGPGFIYDSHYVWQNNEDDRVFTELLQGIKKFAKQLNIPVLCMYEEAGSPYIESFSKCGSRKVFDARGMDYYVLDVE